jgi:hypothetical protein
MRPIYVTKTFLPPLEEFVDLLKEEMWRTHLVTNDGPLFQRFEQDLREFTGIPNLVCVGNGTLALQIAIRALNLNGGEILTTPLTHVAGSDCLIWEQCKPVYVDIDPNTLNIDPEKIEEKITKHTKGIIGVHVYSNPCDVEAIELIAKKHGLIVLYDAAHAFGVRHNGRSLLSYGDISMTSFNATKVFHTIEGGALFCQDAKMVKSIRELAYFGMDEKKNIVQQYGTNAKLIEVCAAMGIINLRYFEEANKRREKAYELYRSLLESHERIRFQKLTGEINYSYMPIILSSEDLKFELMEKLKAHEIYPREYFYPSLETVFSDKIECEIAYDISRRVLCLPMSDYLTTDDVNRICDVINMVR